VNALRIAVKASDPKALGPSTLPSDSFSERRYCIFYADDGGLLSTNEQNEAGEDLYYLGIIDILTPYNYVKKIEHYWKSLSQDKVSTCSPLLDARHSSYPDLSRRVFTYAETMFDYGGK
jgi:1-phosphatidylinositol-4-phosphate 5-kinase